VNASGSTRRRGEAKSVVAVANRLPVQRTSSGWSLSPGGLVTALRPVMEQRTGSWVGWDGGARGTPDQLPQTATQLRPVRLRPAELDAFYLGFANRTLWPLLHNAIERPCSTGRGGLTTARSTSASQAPPSTPPTAPTQPCGCTTIT
jgi:trehalose-6-phosphate synthase